MIESASLPASPALLRGRLHCGRFTLEVSRPLIMGVINVTPDSFSDGGRFVQVDAATAHAHELAQQGADLLDIGGESTRPGARPVPAGEELERVLPVLKALRDLELPLSVDTRKPEVMRAALAEGASMINDIDALQSEAALEAVAGSDCAVCLMHKQGDPQSMQQDPRYVDVVGEVREFLARRVAACETSGISRSRIVIDPGFGFGKRAVHNLALLRNLPALASLGVPLLVGLSRKSTLGRITGQPVEGRTAASVAAAVLAVERGAAIVRVHDVAATRDALSVLSAVDGVDGFDD